jgi:hypothetical protein
MQQLMREQTQTRLMDALFAPGNELGYVQIVLMASSGAG